MARKENTPQEPTRHIRAYSRPPQRWLRSSSRRVLPTAQKAPARSSRASRPDHGLPRHIPRGYDEETEVFTQKGWKKFPEVTVDDLLACRIEGRLEFHRPARIIAERYKGSVCGVRTPRFEYLVTPKLRVYSGCYDQRSEHMRLRRADDVHEVDRRFISTHAPYTGKQQKSFSLPEAESLLRPGRRKSTARIVGEIPLIDWAEFMGWYLARGGHAYEECTYCYRVWISQPRRKDMGEFGGIRHDIGKSGGKGKNIGDCEGIAALLDRLPFTYSQHGNTYSISSKQLAGYLDTLVGIPEYFFHAPVDVRRKLMETLLAAKNRGAGQRVFSTVKDGLACDFERLAIGLGSPVIHRVYPNNREEHYRDRHEVRILHSQWLTVRRKHYYITEYDGTVYCAEIPGGLLYIRRGAKCGIWSGSSDMTPLETIRSVVAFPGHES